MSEQIFQCEQCQQRYNLFRRKKQCDLCGQIFCSKCIPRSLLNNSRACPICLIITNERTTRDQLAEIRIKHLRAYLIHSKIISINRLESCFEKQDLINLIESKKRTRPFQSYVFVERPNTNNNNTTETININHHEEVEQRIINENEQASSLNSTSSIPSNEPEEEFPIDPSPPPPPSAKSRPGRITLDDLSSLESIHELTVRQLKDILIQNFVSIKGCVEKNELINKVELLYRDQKGSNTNVPTGQSDENLCKICMDANIDCVFLDCGHLCTCVQCGKRLSECPLCRSYIIRVVRVFKS